MSANGHGHDTPRQSTPAIDRALAPRKPDGGSFTEMTLRDFFAAKAMQGYSARMHQAEGEEWPSFADRARWAYEQADAMLTERDKRAEPTP